MVGSPILLPWLRPMNVRRLEGESGSSHTVRTVDSRVAKRKSLCSLNVGMELGAVVNKPILRMA